MWHILYNTGCSSHTKRATDLWPRRDSLEASLSTRQPLQSPWHPGLSWAEDVGGNWRSAVRDTLGTPGSPPFSWCRFGCSGFFAPVLTILGRQLPQTKLPLTSGSRFLRRAQSVLKPGLAPDSLPLGSRGPRPVPGHGPSGSRVPRCSSSSCGPSSSSGSSDSFGPRRGDSQWRGLCSQLRWP